MGNQGLGGQVCAPRPPGLGPSGLCPCLCLVLCKTLGEEDSGSGGPRRVGREARGAGMHVGVWFLCVCVHVCTGKGALPCFFIRSHLGPLGPLCSCGWCSEDMETPF